MELYHQSDGLVGRNMTVFDWNISLGNALTIVSFLVGGVVFVVAVRGQVDALAGRMAFVEQELRKLLEILIQQGRHDERMAAMDSRIQAQGQRLAQMTVRGNRTMTHV